MNKIQAAYQKLGIAPGSSLEIARKRYRQLAMVWHPDRMPTSEGRRTAEEELKQINNAFDCVKKHFESEHRQGAACECQPAASNQQTGSTGYGNGAHGNAGGQGATSAGSYRRDKTAYEKWAEQEGRAESERRRAEEAQAAALRESLEKAKRAAEAQQTAAAAAAKGKALAEHPPYTDQQLRWHIATGLAVIFVFLLIGGYNKRYEQPADRTSEFSLSSSIGREHLRPSPF